MAATDVANLKDLVARVWGIEVLQELEDEDFRRLQDGKYTSKLRLERATAESLIASGLNRAIVDVIVGRTSGAAFHQWCCSYFCRILMLSPLHLYWKVHASWILVSFFRWQNPLRALP